MTTALNIQWPYVLRRGHSDNPAEGACAMDAVNWLMHGKHGDTPECACRLIGAYVIRGNDSMPDEMRQRLIPYLHRIAGSRSKKHEAARCRILWLGAVRIFAPRALDAVGLTGEAAKLRALPDNVTAAAAYAAAQGARAAADAADAAAKAAAAAYAAAYYAAAAAYAAAQGAWAAAYAARAAAAAWDDYFLVLDQVLNAGPQGEPWSADVVSCGVNAYREAGGLVNA